MLLVIPVLLVVPPPSREVSASSSCQSSYELAVGSWRRVRGACSMVMWWCGFPSFLMVALLLVVVLSVELACPRARYRVM